MIILIFAGLTDYAFAERFGVSRRGGMNNFLSFGQGSVKQSTDLSQATTKRNEELPNTVSAFSGEAATKTASNAAILSSSASQSPISQIKIPQTGEMFKALPNVVRLVAFDNSGQSFGSGSYIGNYDDYGLILSNWHVVCESDGLVHVHFPNGFSSFGAIINSDKTWDLAMIVVSKPPQTIPSLPIARTVPKPGDSLWIAGHGSGSYRLAGGTCVRYLAPEIPKNGSPPLYEIIELSVTARQGDSGGPILNQDGELAGVLFGSDMIRNTAGSYCQRVNRFLGQTRPELDRLPKRPEEFFVSVEPSGPKRQLAESLNTVPTKKMYAETPKRNTDFAGAGGFGVRSPSRRYTQPANPTSVAVFEAPKGIPSSLANQNPTIQANPIVTETPKKDSESSKTGQNDQNKSASAQSVRSAVWTETLPSTDVSAQKQTSSSILQTKHNISSSANGTITNNRQATMQSIPSPFDNDLSALNPRGTPTNTLTDLPKLSAVPQFAEINGSYGRQADSSGMRQSATNPVIWGSIFIACIAGVLVFFSIKLLRADHRQSESETILSASEFRNRKEEKAERYNEANAA